MKYNPAIHNRQSIRLKGYDYTQAGAYFITICTQNFECLFGYIEHDRCILNPAGQMVENWCLELENKFPDVHCYRHVVMPNHFHAILMKSPLPHGITKTGQSNNSTAQNPGASLSRIVQWFKTMTTNAYIRGVKQSVCNCPDNAICTCNGWKAFDGKLWQRNYYEHIIRNEQSLKNISDYILNNPARWQQDKFYKNA